jgi:hypothetical protein
MVPFIQFPWSHTVGQGWELFGVFTITWLPSEPTRNLVFEPTLSLGAGIRSIIDAFVEYVGDYGHQRPSQVLNTGEDWRLSKTQQIDFHVSYGLISNTIYRYFGICYWMRLARLLGGAVDRSP